MKDLKIIFIIGLVVAIALAVIAIGDIRSKPWKLNRFAFDFQDDMLCSFHKSTTEQDKCFSVYASRLNSSDSCLNIEDTDKRDHCLIRMLFRGNRLDCEIVSDSYLRSSCESIMKYELNREYELEEYVFDG